MVWIYIYIHIHATHFGVRGGFVVREMEFFIGARPSGIFTSPGAPGQWGEYLRRPNHEGLPCARAARAVVGTPDSSYLQVQLRLLTMVATCSNM